MANAPVNKVTVGNVTVSVWENTVKVKGKDPFTTQSISVQKNYKDGDEWKSSSSFKFSEIPLLILALQKAYADKYIRDDISEVTFEE